MDARVITTAASPASAVLSNSCMKASGVAWLVVGPVVAVAGTGVLVLGCWVDGVPVVLSGASVCDPAVEV